MGLTTAEESSEVERMAARYPEIQAELDEIRLSLESYAMSYSKQPPADVKAKVMDAIRSEGKETKVIDIRNAERPRSRFAKYAAAAAVILLLVSFAFNLSMYNRIKVAERNNDQLAERNEEIQKQLQASGDRMLAMESEMEIMRDPRNKMIRLNGMDAYPSSMVTVYWNTASKEVFADVNMLPPAPEGMQYQLWAIVDGKPVDAGMIDMSTPGIHKMKTFDSAQAFAVTLEKAGGSPTPNLSALYVMGNV
jgi:anti-sigma-K factor RskA